jgi:hypothetical protein
MKVTKFSEKVAKMEGKKEEINIAQIKEILSIVNKLTYGILYLVIRLLPSCK